MQDSTGPNTAPPAHFDIGDPTSPDLIVPLPIEALAPIEVLSPILEPVLSVPPPPPPPLHTPPPRAPTSGPKLAAVSPYGAWPAYIASKEEARLFLLGVADPGPKFRDATARVVATLPAEARAALAGEPLPFDGSPLFELAVSAWRVAAALATTPAPGTPWSSDAKAALLAEADVALMGVAMADAPLREIAKGAKAALTKDAVALSERVIAPAAPAAAAAAVRESTRSVSEPAEARDARRPLFFAALVLGLISAVFHVWRLSGGGTEGVVPPQARVLEMKSPNAGNYRIVQASGSSSRSEAAQKAESLARESGNQVVKVGERVFVVAPKGASPLGMKR